MKKIILYTSILLTIAMVSCCKKDKSECHSNKVQPFLQKVGRYECNYNTGPYQKVFWSIDDIDAAQPDCYYPSGIALYPIDYDSNVYIVVADTFFNHGDTITGEVLVDTCKKELTYNVKFEKGNGAPNNYPGLVSIFCIVENITTNYKITINKQRNNVP